MRIIWSPTAQSSARRFVKDDQDGVRAVNQAVAALADNPSPAEARRYGRDGDYRLRVGRYRVMYRVAEDLITIGRVDRVAPTGP